MSQEIANTLWLAFAGCLVFFMQAGFAMLETGLVRSKNTVNVLMKNYIDLAAGSVAFFLVGYGLMFGANATGWFGIPGTVTDSKPIVLFFQMMFAATAATIVSGAVAERIRYWAYVVMGVAIAGFIYPVYGSWAWRGLSEGQGWLRSVGFIDFAGSAVVHSIGGWVALAGVVVLGPRRGRFGAAGEVRPISGHSLPLVALGGLILWLGWFGFNAGSTLEANTSIGTILLNTHLSGSGGLLGSILILAILRRPILMTSTLNGGLGGMVAICAGANTVGHFSALIIGLIAGIIVVLAEQVLLSLRIDDAVGAVAVHGFGGLWGTLAVALFREGQLFDVGQLIIQAIGGLAAFVWGFGGGWVLFKLLGLAMKVRATTTDERRGLDFVEHYEVAYPEFQQDLLHAGKE